MATLQRLLRNPALLAMLQEEEPQVFKRALRQPMPEEYGDGGSSTQLPATFRRAVDLPVAETAPTIQHPNVSPSWAVEGLKRGPTIEQPLEQPPVFQRPTRIAPLSLVENVSPDPATFTRSRRVIPEVEMTPQGKTALAATFQRQAGLPIEANVVVPNTQAIERPITPLYDVPPQPYRERFARPEEQPGEIEKDILAIRDRETAPLYDPDESGRIKRPPGFLSHLKAAGKMALQGFMRGGLPGAVGGAITGAVDPTAPAKFRRQQQIAAAGQRLQRDLGIAKAQGDIAGSQADAAWKLNRINREPAEADERERDNIAGIYKNLPSFDPDANPQHRQMATRAQALGMVLPKKARGERTRPHVKGGDGNYYYLNDDGTPAERVPGVPGDRLIDWAAPDGKTYRITEAQAAANAAQAANQTYVRGRQEAGDTDAAAQREAENQNKLRQAEGLESEADRDELKAKGTIGMDETDQRTLLNEARRKRDEARKLRNSTLPPLSARPTPSTNNAPASESVKQDYYNKIKAAGGTDEEAAEAVRRRYGR